MASPLDFIRASIEAYNGSAVQNSSSPAPSSSAPASRTSAVEDYYNEQMQKKQATEKARDIIDDRGRGNRSYTRNEYLKKSGGVKSTTVDSRGNNSALRKEYQRQNPNTPKMSTVLSDNEKFQLQSAYADAANKYKTASKKAQSVSDKKAQSIRPEAGVNYATTLEKYRSELQAASDEKAAAESEMDRLRKQLEFYNVELPDLNQNVFERLWGSVKGGSKQAAGSLGGAAGYTGRVATGSQNAVDKALRASGNEELSALYHVGTEEENAKAMQMQQAIADKSAELSESGGRDIERSKWGASGAGKFALDAVSQVPALAADMAANAVLPGAGMAMMMGRSFGGGVQEAEAGGANLAQAGAYGAASAAVESLTEKLTGGLDIAYGKGFTDKVTEKLIGKLAKSDAGRTAFRAITGALGEGAEEFISSAVNPTIRAIYNGKSIGENYSEEQVSDWLYDGLVGAALGLAGSGVGIATGADAKKNAELRSGSIDSAIELMTGKKATSEPQSATETQGDITTPPTPSNDTVARPEELNSTIYNNVEMQNADVQKNTAPNETESTAVNDNPATHTAEEMTRIEDYKASTDESLKEVVEEYYADPKKPFSRHNISSVTEKQATDIASVLGGGNYNGFKNAINSDGIKHILNEHGPNGSVNHSMGDLNDIARIGYVLDNYDDVRLATYPSGDQRFSEGFQNSDNSPAPMVVFTKKVNGTYYVVEAVPDTKYKKLWVVSAYLDKKGGVTQASDATSPEVTPKTSLASPPQSENIFSDNSIPTTQQNVNSGQVENSGRERERGFSKNVRTDNAMESDIRQSFDENPENYSQLANKDTLSKAKEIYDKGLPTARSTVEQALGAAKSGQKLAPEMVPLARMVANELSRSGEVESARNILADVATELTAAGQLGQAGRIMRDSDPNTALRSIEKSLEAINDEFSKQHKHSDWKAELTDAEREKILSTDFTEEGAYQSIYEEITRRIGKEMPSSVFEKLTEIRRINMLLRPKTMIKNVVSNVPMVGLRKGAETLSIGIQSALTKMGAMDSSERTRGMASKEQKQLASDFYEANKGDINGQSNKWDMKSMLQQNRTIFKGGAIEKAMSKMTGKEIQPFGEALRQVTYDLLEKGDAPFVKSAFVDSLSQYCAAKGITSQDGITREAIDFATANAMEATFKNANLVASLINKVKRESSPSVSMAVDVLIPFTTTPANILTLMGDYSPVGFAKMFAKDGPAAKIDAFSKATVGSAIMALGFALRNADMITGGEDDDKDKAALDKATGRGNYSIGGKVSYDWAQPAGSLLAFGAEIADAIKGQESWDSALMNAIYTAGDSTLNLSLFQNVISVLKGSGKPTQQIIDSIMDGGATQLVPGLAGDIAKIIDGTVRSTYTGGNAFDDTAAKVKAVTPLLSKSLPESVNVKGETNTRGNLAERTFNTLINPFNVTRGKRNEVDEEIYRLYDSTGSKTFFPSVSPYKVEYDSKEYSMDGGDRETFQKIQGQKYYELAKPLLDSEMYKSLTDEQKANVLNSVRDFALDAAKRDFVGGKSGQYSSSWDDENQLKSLSEFLTAKQALNDGKSGKSDNFDAIDQVLKNFGHLKDDTQTALKASGLNVNNLLYAQTKGIKSKSWYDAKTAVDAAKGTLGSTDNAKAIAVYNSMKGKSDEEILDAIRTQVTPAAGGKQSAVVRRAEAYMTIAKDNADLGSWLDLVAELNDADTNSSVSRSDVYAAWANMGLSAQGTYAGITRNDFYNIVKSSKSYATKEKYATQIDEDYAKINPAVEKEKAQLGGTVEGHSKEKSSSTTYTMDDYYRALGLIK